MATTAIKSYIDLGCGGSKFYIAVSTLLLDAVKLFSIKNICIFKYMSQTNRESPSNQSRFWGPDLGRSNDQVTTTIMIIFPGSTLFLFFFLMTQCSVLGIVSSLVHGDSACPPEHFYSLQQ